MAKKIPIEEIKKRIADVHGDLITIDERTYLAVREKARFIDSEYGEFFSVVYSVLIGHGHITRRKENLIKNNIEKYGVENVSQLDWVKKKKKDSAIKKYGCDCVFQSDEVKTKSKKTMSEKYGVEHALQSAQIIEKTKKTMLEKYGVEYALQNKEIYDKFVKTCIENFGVEHPLLLPEIVDRIQKTNLEKYGNVCTLRNKDVDEKTRKTCMERYGVLYPTQNKEIMEKVRKNNMKKYGVEYTMQNLEILLKNAKSQNKSVIKAHWKTGKEVVCVGSYEAAVVDYLNENKINYEWQNKTFAVLDGKFYTPDLYLVDEDKWIEIKGYFRKDAKEKWDYFCLEHKNAELWDKNRLKKLGIL